MNSLKFTCMIQVAIIGGAGYTGGELIRLLINHPFVDLSCIVSESQAGKLVSSVHTDLVGDTDLMFAPKLDGNPEVIFYVPVMVKQRILFLQTKLDKKHVLSI